jgi:tRNA threonylcarbamoyladenosine biosynthesis protein TsaB
LPSPICHYSLFPFHSSLFITEIPLLVLGFETSTPKLSVALYNEQTILAEIMVDGKGRQPLLQAVEELLIVSEKKKEELTGVAYSKGPGAFTGLRVGLATAKGIAFTLKIPIVGVGTLFAFAQKYQNKQSLVAPLLDAKKGEIYGALYEEGNELLAACALSPQKMCEALIAAANDKQILCVGDGAALIHDLPKSILVAQVHPSASEVARQGAVLLAQGIHDDLTATTPTYLRLPEAVVNAQKKSLAAEQKS